MLTQTPCLPSGKGRGPTMAERVTREELAEALRDLHLYEPVADGRCLFCLGTRPSQCRPVDHAPLCLWAASKRVLSRLDAEQNGGGE